MDHIVSNINSLSIDVVAEIEKELDPYDVVSLVFLLYNSADIALKRLKMYRVYAADDTNRSLLYDWAKQAQQRASWKYEFLEALTVCQLNKVIKKLGFNIQIVKNHYLPNNVHSSVNLNPMKKALYRMCENMTSDNLQKLKNTLSTYDIDTTEYKSCELILLHLLCKDFIAIGSSNAKCKIEKLATIIQNLPKLQPFADDLIHLQQRLNANDQKAQSSSMNVTSTPKDSSDNSMSEDNEEKGVAPKDFQDLFEQIAKLAIEEPDLQDLKMDARKVRKDVYPLKNPNRIGVCYIINEEEFYPSKESIEGRSQSEPIPKRVGTNKDQIVLDKTFSALKFEVICHRNICHKKMVEGIKNILEYRVQPDDSIFMVCIMSHGVRGHVYAADSVKVKVDDIINLMDNGLMKRNLDIPKVLILQACQVNNDEPAVKLVADSPSAFHIKKSNFLIFCATAPELEAYRHEQMGSIFIQILCHILQKEAKCEHLTDLFTKVNKGVEQICKKLEREQMPQFKSTLTRKLYLVS